MRQASGLLFALLASGAAQAAPQSTPMTAQTFEINKPSQLATIWADKIPAAVAARQHLIDQNIKGLHPLAALSALTATFTVSGGTLLVSSLDRPCQSQNWAPVGTFPETAYCTLRVTLVSADGDKTIAEVADVCEAQAFADKAGESLLTDSPVVRTVATFDPTTRTLAISATANGGPACQSTDNKPLHLNY